MHFHFALHPTGSVAGPAVCFIFYGRYTKWSIIARCHRWAEIRRRLCVRVSSLHGVPSHDKGHISVSHRPVNHLYANASQVVLVVLKKKKYASQGSRYKRYGFDPSGLEDPLEKEMASLSSILAWRIPWTEEPGRAAVHGVAEESDMTEVASQPHVQMRVLLS